MKNTFRLLIIVLSCILIAGYGYAEKYRAKTNNKSTATLKSTAAGCLPGSGFKYLDLNNVRCRINTGGDMWWDLEVPQYEIPKGSKKTSMFAGSLWIAGVDENDQLKCAAVRYRQGPNFGGGNDYWPGPLTIDDKAAISEATCSKYDKIFPISRNEVDQFLAWTVSPDDYPGYSIPTSIKDWPAHGDPALNQSFYLAPFKDVNENLIYEPEAGDYPYYDLANGLCHSKQPTIETEQGINKGGLLADQVIKGDQTLWWVFNDKGNIHTETQGQAIGLEIRGQAFAFATNDEINNMTFYSYEIINRSTYRLKDTYFSQWTDPDLGFPKDDRVGCDVLRGLGYCYNGRPIDGAGQYNAYGDQPPAIGIDFFQGPYMDADGYDNPSFDASSTKGPSFHGDCSIVTLNNNTITMNYGPSNGLSGQFLVKSEAINGVNFGNGIVDDERFGMRRFVYHNNTGVPDYMTDPDYAPEYYNFLKGIWKDNTKMIYGGNAHTTGGGYGPECDFMFPGDSDPCDWGTKGIPPNGPRYWTEVTAGNPAEDRRFMQSAGPFTLEPGAVNYITVGMPWARATSGGAWASVELLRVIDDKCQQLFDNCFAVVSGPNAPDLVIRELDKEFIIYIQNKKTNDVGNNSNESYEEIDPSIKSPDTVLAPNRYDSTYNFEGYQVFQLYDASVSVADIHDASKARLVSQCDIQNGVTKLVNFYYDQSLNGNVPVMEVDGADKGISHSFVVTEDKFTGEALVNHKQYYYLAVAYGYNNYERYDPNDPSAYKGQKKPYLAGRKNIKVYTGIPHITIGETTPSASYGDGPIITRIQGQGNGGLVLDLAQETINEIMSKPPADSLNNVYGSDTYPIAYKPIYQNGKTPIQIKVIDPLNVKNGSYTIRFDTLYDSLFYNVSGQTVNAGGDTAVKQIGNWSLIDNNTGEVVPFYEPSGATKQAILTDNEKLFLDLGFSVKVNQVYNPSVYIVGKITDGSDLNDVTAMLVPNNGFLESSIEFADSSKRWLTGIADEDGPVPTNWIRSGTAADNNDPAYNDWSMKIGTDGTPIGIAYDPNADYEKVLGGTWAPYNMVACGPTINAQGNFTDEGQSPVAPAISFKSKEVWNAKSFGSVDVIFTSDKSKWTRSLVIETCPDFLLAEGGVKKFHIRAGRSVDKNGNFAPVDAQPSNDPENPAYIAATGMGWFPGYAINIETGERLNIMFGEDSWLSSENGRDMLWNPTSNLYSGGEPVFGGRHFVYIMAHAKIVAKRGPLTNTFENPAYDACVQLRKQILIPKLDFIPVSVLSPRDLAYATCMWVNIPIAVRGQNWLDNDVKVRLRVAKPYERWYSVPLDSLMAIQHNDNNNYPKYVFNTENIATVTKNVQKAKSDLDLINVVPNPYYAFSNYEANQLDNRIKIINLPKKCVVTIYNLSGTTIRQFTKDDMQTEIEWDLKNFAGIPISGGVYLIHVKAEGYGEKIIKWFGTLRPIDLNAF
ncbi:MAG: T9SS type A sorting domain-containing protein [Lentimicrobiaceae bacterium]|nr:T9SS type A sorting domain-containing protein [Lentimicrobiaceae bacterium]